jgi:hypothetical protein
MIRFGQLTDIKIKEYRVAPQGDALKQLDVAYRGETQKGQTYGGEFVLDEHFFTGNARFDSNGKNTAFCLKPDEPVQHRQAEIQQDLTRLRQFCVSAMKELETAQAKAQATLKKKVSQITSRFLVK